MSSTSELYDTDYGAWARRQVELLSGRRLQKSPGLSPLLDALTAEAYTDAVGLAAKETGLAHDRFPAACPWTTAQVLDDGYFPPAAD
jgi:hypothetical protein